VHIFKPRWDGKHWNIFIECASNIRYYRLQNDTSIYCSFTAHVLLMYKKYLTVWTVPKFDKANSQKDTKAIPLTQKYTTAYFPGLAQELQYKVAWLTNFMGLGLPLFVKWYDRAIVSQMWVKCQPSHIIRENMICWVVFFFFFTYSWNMMLLIILKSKCDITD
jgi:hypothetical protein